MLTPGNRGATLAEIESVYRRRFHEYVGVAAAILGSREASRDAVQEAFATVVRRRRDFRGDGSLDAWLWRAVVNRALSERRRQPPVAELADDARSGSANGVGSGDDVRQAIDCLPERQRLIVFLRYYADLDYAAIAQVLEIAPGTVAAALHAAHRSMRDQLQEVAT
jgi:RNA polymerase sigma-70 factor (ECF subfamily)